MAIKRISQFPSGVPTADDKILFEQDGNGKSATIGDAVNTCSLTYEEIMGSTDLSGKVASASATKYIEDLINERVLYAGRFRTVADIKNWVVQEKPARAWVADVPDAACTVALGTIYNSYEGGYAGFIAFHYFSTSVDIYRLNNGTWNK